MTPLGLGGRLFISRLYVYLTRLKRRLRHPLIRLRRLRMLQQRIPPIHTVKLSIGLVIVEILT